MSQNQIQCLTGSRVRFGTWTFGVPRRRIPFLASSRVAFLVRASGLGEPLEARAPSGVPWLA
jgi:hypothetical protein